MEQPGRERGGENLRIAPGDLAAVGELAGLQAARDQTGGELAKAERHVEVPAQLLKHLRIKRGDVHCVLDLAGREEVGQQVNRFDGDLRLSLFSARSEMRRAEDARHAEQRAVRAGLFGEDVEGDAADLARLQPFNQRRFVVDAAAGRVDQPHARLHAFKLRDVDQISGLFGERRVDREVIDVRQHVVNLLVPLDAEFLRLLLRHERVVAEHSHLQRLGPLHHCETDTAKADDAERLAGDLGAHVLRTIPATFDQRLIRRGDIARERQHQRDRMLGGAQRVAGRGVHHDDAGPRGGGAVDVVGADAGPHDRLQPAVTLQHVGGDLHAAAADGAVEFRQRLPEVFAFESRANLVSNAGRGVQQIETFLRERVENDDRGHDVIA